MQKKEQDRKGSYENRLAYHHNAILDKADEIKRLEEVERQLLERLQFSQNLEKTVTRKLRDIIKGTKQMPRERVQSKTSSEFSKGQVAANLTTNANTDAGSSGLGQLIYKSYMEKEIE